MILFRMMTHETHLSAEQASPQKSPRLPLTHENSRGTQSNQTPPKSRPESLSSLSNYFGFPKRLKLRKRAEFLRAKQGRRLIGQTICIDWRRTSQQETRLGITASTRYGNSPERNRFKRRIREAFRLARPLLPCSLDLNISPRTSAKTALFSTILNELIQLLKHAIK